jgi:hypothetical protein
MVAPKDEKVRLMLLKTYFSMFRKILGEEEKKEGEEKKVEVKKDRTKSK